MKRFFVFSLLVLLSASTLVAQKGEPVIECNGVELYGKIKSAKISYYQMTQMGGKDVELPQSAYSFALHKGGAIKEQVEYDANGAMISKAVFKLNSKGQEVESSLIYYEPKAYVAYKTKYEHDSKGNPVSTVTYNADGTIEAKCSAKYDANGNVIEYVEYSGADCTIDVKYSMKYDANGNVIERVKYDGTGAMQSKNVTDYTADGKMTFQAQYGANHSLEWKTLIKYDSNGLRTEEISYSGDGTLEWRNELKHDSKGNLLGGTKYAADGTVVHTRLVEYDANNNITLDLMRDASGNVLAKIESKYDSNGNLIEFHQCNNVDLDDKWLVKYDSNNNPIEYIITSPSSDTPPTKIVIDIVYYKK